MALGNGARRSSTTVSIRRRLACAYERYANTGRFLGTLDNARMVAAGWIPSAFDLVVHRAITRGLDRSFDGDPDSCSRRSDYQDQQDSSPKKISRRRFPLLSAASTADVASRRELGGRKGSVRPLELSREAVRRFTSSMERLGNRSRYDAGSLRRASTTQDEQALRQIESNECDSETGRKCARVQTQRVGLTFLYVEATRCSSITRLQSATAEVDVSRRATRGKVATSR